MICQSPCFCNKVSSVDGCILRVWLHFSLEVPDVPQLPGMRKMTKEDVPRVHNLVSNYLRWFTHWGKTWKPGVWCVFHAGGNGFFSAKNTLSPLERFGSWCVHFVSFHICILIWWNLQFSGRSRHQDSCTVQRELIHSAPEIQGNLLRKGASLTSISWI